jgi:hypothetical protein
MVRRYKVSTAPSAHIKRERQPVKPCDRNIQSTLHLVEEMIRLADQGDLDREDTDCGILYGVLRDSAYKIKRLAEIEKAKHEKRGGGASWHANRDGIVQQAPPTTEKGR